MNNTDVGLKILFFFTLLNMQNIRSELWGSCNRVVEVSGFLGYDAASSGEWLPQWRH